MHACHAIPGISVRFAEDQLVRLAWHAAQGPARQGCSSMMLLASYAPKASIRARTAKHPAPTAQLASTKPSRGSLSVARAPQANMVTPPRVYFRRTTVGHAALANIRMYQLNRPASFVLLAHMAVNSKAKVGRHIVKSVRSPNTLHPRGKLRAKAAGRVHTRLLSSKPRAPHALLVPRATCAWAAATISRAPVTRVRLAR